MVGLGRTGANMTRRLVDAGHEVVVDDRDLTLVRFAARIVAALRNRFGGHSFFTEAMAAEDQKE